MSSTSRHLFKIRWLNSKEHGTKNETLRYSPVNLIGQDSTKSVYITIQSLPQSTVTYIAI